MVEGLSKGIRESLNQYYRNRDNQAVLEYSNGVLKERGWNKGEDLGRIFTEAKKEGWAVEACAGTFWFKKKLMRGYHVIEVHEKTLVEGGVSNIKLEGESFGALAEIANALRRTGREPFFIRDEKDVDTLEKIVLGKNGGDSDAGN